MLDKLKMNSKREKNTLITYTNPHAVISEEFKNLRTNIQFAMANGSCKTIMFTSANKGEGKSTVIANTAISFASQDKKVLLVDADLRAPNLHELFHIENSKGLSNLLSDREVNLSSVLHQTPQQNLTLLTSGPIPYNPTELIDSDQMDAVINSLKEEFDLILFDMPPIIAVTEAQVMAARVDGTVFVIRSGVTDKKQLLKAKELLEYAKANVLGAVLNDKKTNKRNAADYYGYGTR